MRMLRVHGTRTVLDRLLLQVLEGNWQDYLYIACVRFTKRVKKGPLQETSPLINDISGVPSWEKVGSVGFRVQSKCAFSITCGIHGIARNPQTTGFRV